MNIHRSLLRSRRIRQAVLLGSALVAALCGCGVEEHSPGAARVPPPAQPVASGAFENPDDTTITSVQFDTSLELVEDCTDLGYDPLDPDCVFAFFGIRNQDADSLQDFTAPAGIPGFFEVNEQNFTVTLFPAVAPEIVDPASFSIGQAFRDNKVIGLIIDTSGSMESPAGGTPTPTRLDVAKEAAKNFVDLMDSLGGDRTALITFNTNAQIVVPLTDDVDELKQAIDGLETTGSTNFGAAMSTAADALGVTPGKRAVLFLTDGNDESDPIDGGPDVWFGNDNSTRFQGLERVIDSELVVYTVGLGDGLGVDGIADLNRIADETGGSFFAAPTAADLDDAFTTTIPNEVESQPGLTAPFVAFPNPVDAVPGQRLSVPVFIELTFENGIAEHRDGSFVNYTIR